MSDMISKIKEFWNNKKYRALTSLGFYVLIIILAFIFIAINKSNTNINDGETYLSILDKYEQISNYQVSYQINEDETITGYVINNNLSINYNGKNYDINSEVTDKEITALLNRINLLKLMPKDIYGLINKGTKISASTDYKNNVNINSYEVSLTNFISAYENKESTLTDNIMITTYENDTRIFKVELDLIKYNNLIVIINYSNVDGQE